RLVSVPLGGGAETFLTETFFDRDRFGQSDVFPDQSAVKLEASFTGPQAEELFKVPAGGGPVERLSPATVEVTGTVSGHVQSLGGQFVFYLADRDVEGLFQLYRAPIDGGDPVNPAVGPGLEGNDRVDSPPVLAAASNTAIFEVLRVGEPRELWAKTFAGDLRLLREVDNFTRYQIIPPGQVLVHLEDGDLKEIDLATGAERVLEDLATPIEDFMVSEDGSRLVLETGGSAFTLPTVGGTPTDLGTTRDPVLISPDGSWVLFDDFSNDYLLLSADGQTVTPLEDWGFGPRFSDDSSHLIYRASSSPVELRSYEISTEVVTRLDEGLVRPPDFTGVEWWSAGGRDVVFTFTRGSFRSRNLYRIRADGGGLQTALGPPEDSLDIRDIHVSPDGRFAAFQVTNLDDNSLSDLYLTSITEGRTARLLDDADEAVFLGFTPDLSLALYQNQRPAYSSPLMAAPTDGSSPFALTPADFGDVQPGLDFGPGGNTVTFRVQRHNERTELHALDIDDILIFTDGFESGDLSAWAGVVP
ncbi:MAG: hypothetical protein AAGF23_13410, partial [Acidobacteriota bacterium]